MTISLPTDFGTEHGRCDGPLTRHPRSALLISLDNRKEACGLCSNRIRPSNNCLLLDGLEFLDPANEHVGCRVGLLLSLRALDRVQHLVALVDSGTRLLLASKANGILKITDDPTVPEVQLRCEVELMYHARR